MPATALAAGVSDQYRLEVLRTREVAAVAVAAAWSSIDLDQPSKALTADLGTFREVAASAIGSAQAAAVDLSSGYLTGYLLAAGHEPAAPGLDVTDFVGIDGTGTALTDALQVATTGMLWQLGRGAGRPVAQQTGLGYAQRVTRTAVVDSARDALTAVMTKSRLVTGWQRLTAATSCSRCAADSGHVHRPAYPLRSHPSCRCLAEPVVLGRSAFTRAAPEVVRP